MKWNLRLCQIDQDHRLSSFSTISARCRLWNETQPTHARPPSTSYNHKIYSGTSLAVKLYNLNARSHISLSHGLISLFLLASSQLSPASPSQLSFTRTPVSSWSSVSLPRRLKYCWIFCDKHVGLESGIDLLLCNYSIFSFAQLLPDGLAGRRPVIKASFGCESECLEIIRLQHSQVEPGRAIVRVMKFGNDLQTMGRLMTPSSA